MKTIEEIEAMKKEEAKMLEALQKEVTKKQRKAQGKLSKLGIKLKGDKKCVSLSERILLDLAVSFSIN